VSDLSVADRPSISIDAAAIRLTDTILGYNEEDLAETLKAIASAIGVAHISYVRFAPDKSSDTSMLTAAVTYSRDWQLRYFFKEYLKVDPVIAHGRHAVLPFDWETLISDDPGVIDFFADAAHFNVGRNGISDPGAQPKRGLFGGLFLKRRFAIGMGSLQDQQYREASAVVGPDRLGGQH
jgi:hypothetical protein